MEAMRDRGHIHKAQDGRQRHVGQGDVAGAGKTRSTPSIRHRASSKAIACAESGMQRSRPCFMRLPGTVQTRALRSISDQVAPRTSPEWAAVRTANFRAQAPMPSTPRNAFIKVLTSSTGRGGAMFDPRNLRRLSQELIEVAAPASRIEALAMAARGCPIKDQLDSPAQPRRSFRLGRPNRLKDGQHVGQLDISDQEVANRRLGIDGQGVPPLLGVFGVPPACFMGGDIGGSR